MINYKYVSRFCPACGSSESSLIFSDYNRREGYSELFAKFVRCARCGMRYLTDVPDFSEFKEKYTEIYVQPDLGALRAKLSLVHKNNGLRVLDVGCNYGEQLIPYWNDGYEVFGIDLNPKAVTDASLLFPTGLFKNCTIDNASFPEAYFDVVRSSHVLEHVYNPIAFLRDCLRFLKPGGRLEIRVPNGKSLEMLVMRKYASQSWIPFHMNMFSPGTLKKIVRGVGYSNVSTITRAVPWWWILSCRQWIGTINAGRGITNFHRHGLTNLLLAVFFPFSVIFASLGFGDEIILTATKPR